VAAITYRLGQLVGSVAKGYRDASRDKTAKPKPPEVSTEKGFTGLKVFAGLIDEEYQETLDDLQDRIETFDKMRADGDVSALEGAIILPLLAAEYSVVPHEDAADEKLAQEQADAANAMLDELSVPWGQVQAHAYRGLCNGFSFAEKVWTQRNGMYVWERLAPRRPDSVYEWIFDEEGTGTLAAVSQQGYRVRGDKSEWTQTEPVPVDKLLLWTYRPEYGNPEGRGIFRDVYRHWYIKDKAYTAACIRNERLACPTPIAEPVADAAGNYPDPGTTNLENFQEALGRLRVYEAGAIINPAGYKVSPFELGDPSVPWMDFITHHGGMILRAGLAQFLALGQDGNTGAWALAEDSSSFFLMALAAHAKWFCDVMTRQGLRQWVDANWGRPKDGLYPKMECTGLGVKDKKATAELFRILAGAQENLLERKDEIANVIREAVGVELVPEEEIEAAKQRQEEMEQQGLAAMKQAAKAPAHQQQQVPPQAPVAPQASQKQVGKQPPTANVKAAEDEASCEHGAVLRLADPKFDAALGQAETDFQAEGWQIVQGMIDGYVKKLAPLAEAGDYVRMAELTVPLQGKYENWLRRYLGKVVDLGRERLARDTGREPGPKSRKLTNWVTGKARLLAEGHAANLKWTVCHTLMDSLRGGKKPAAAMGEAGALMASEMTDRLDADLNTAAAEAVEKVQAAEWKAEAMNHAGGASAADYQAQHSEMVTQQE